MEHKSTILIVDDEEVGRDTLEALLITQGYNLVFAGSGPETLIKASEIVPDVILLDVMMPGMTGFEVCRRLRSDFKLAEVPIIMVTALDDHESYLQGIEAGADDFISKPFNRDRLRARIKTITRLNRYRRLISERAKFEWVVEQANDGYLIINEDDDILYANRQARLLLGLPPDSGISITETFLDLIHKQYQCEPNDSWSIWPPQPVGDSPLYLVRPASEHAGACWLQVDLTKMSSDDLSNYLLRVSDVTDSVARQKQMWTFHGQVSHKLRTPLNLLMTSLESLSESSGEMKPEDVQAFFEIAYKGAVRLKDEIQRIFHYIDALSTMRPDLDRCSIEIIAVIVEETATMLGLDPVTVRYDGFKAIDNTWVSLSEHALEMICWELLENAKKFHPRQSPQIEVRIVNTFNRVSIQVMDDGATLSPDQLIKMWTPYYQIEKYFTGQISGTGLGLSTVASLVWSVGGTCRAYNRLDGPGIVIELVVPQVERYVSKFFSSNEASPQP